MYQDQAYHTYPKTLSRVRFVKGHDFKSHGSINKRTDTTNVSYPGDTNIVPK